MGKYFIRLWIWITKYCAYCCITYNKGYCNLGYLSLHEFFISTTNFASTSTYYLIANKKIPKIPNFYTTKVFEHFN